MMADNSAIEWTDATWNPVTGCTKIGPGCDHCYAERFAERFRGVRGHPYEHGFDLTLRPERLSQPSRWRRSRMIFVNSMSDLFHKEVPNAFVDKVFDTMEAAHHHIYQVLPKRSSRLASYVNRRYSQQHHPRVHRRHPSVYPRQSDGLPLPRSAHAHSVRSSKQSRSAREEFA